MSFSAAPTVCRSGQSQQSVFNEIIRVGHVWSSLTSELQHESRQQAIGSSSSTLSGWSLLLQLLFRKKWGNGRITIKKITRHSDGFLSRHKRVYILNFLWSSAVLTYTSVACGQLLCSKLCLSLVIVFCLSHHNTILN